MFKATPNPPDTSIPYDPALDPQKIKAATDRAINFYLNPGALKISIPSTSSCRANRIFLIDPHRGRRNLARRSLRIPGLSHGHARRFRRHAGGAES